MKKILFALFSFSILSVTVSAQSEGIKVYAEKAAENYCTCVGFVKVVDIRLQVLDAKITEAQAKEQMMEFIAEIQSCTVALTPYVEQFELTDQARMEGEALALKIMAEKYPECAKKINKLEAAAK